MSNLPRVFLLLLLLPLSARAQVPLKHIVFGSCLNVTEHPMLDHTLTLLMDLFIFMGDNIYADTADMAVMRAKYARLKESRFFKGLRAKASILATWDDHDYGANDGGADYSMRRESRRSFGIGWMSLRARRCVGRKGFIRRGCLGPRESGRR
ncbi:MAG: hypothetical protein U0984_06955 [Prosthecobacter sp.]|nr:hypothetical protein [Prosthecobacter sp.]